MIRGLILAAACVYAATSGAPRIVRWYFDVLLAHVLILYLALDVFGETSQSYYWTYVGVTIPLLIAGFVVALLCAFIHYRALFVYFVCCGIGVCFAVTLTIIQPPAARSWIMAVECGAFMSMGLLMWVSIPFSHSPMEKFVAIIFAMNWLCKGFFDFAMGLFHFSPVMLELGEVLPFLFFFASAIVVGRAFRTAGPIESYA